MPSASTKTTPDIDIDLVLDSVANQRDETVSKKCENCYLHKAKIVQLRKKISQLKKKRAELYAEIEKVSLSSNLKVYSFLF